MGVDSRAMNDVGLAKTERQKEIRATLSEQAETIQRLEKAVMSIGEKISPVLRQDENSTDMEKEPQPDLSAPLANEIYERTRTINNLVRKLNGYLTACEL